MISFARLEAGTRPGVRDSHAEKGPNQRRDMAEEFEQGEGESKHGVTSFQKSSAPPPA